MNREKPYWWPDAQGFAMIAVMTMCFTALMVRMFHGGPQEDKMLDTMITILFSTCLVGIINYLFGSSRGSASKDETINKIASTTAAQPAAGTFHGRGRYRQGPPCMLALFVAAALLFFPQSGFAQDASEAADHRQHRRRHQGQFRPDR